MTGQIDQRQVRRSFSRAARSYGAAAALQHAVEAQLLESLDYLDGRVPQVVLDLGCGPGTAAATMQARWPKAQVLAMDLALPMLQLHRPARDWRRPFARRPDRVCADARALPLTDASVDVLFCNLCLQWVDDLPAVFAGFRRVLRPGGMLLCSTFGADTLHELRRAFAQADPGDAGQAGHVSGFIDIAGFGDALMQSGFRNPVLDRDVHVLGYPDLAALMAELRALGATNAQATRRRSLTGRARFAAAAAAYAQDARADGSLPASWEIITAMAWAPPPGQPIRSAGIDEVHVPVTSIGVRRRP